MRLIWLYLRSRLAGHALAHLAVLAALGGFGLRKSAGEETLIMLLLIVVPLAAAAVIGAGTRSPFGDVEEAAGRWLPALRFGQLAGLVLLAAAGLAAVAVRWGVDDSEWSLVRNLAGFTGLALLAARFVGGGLSWVAPLAYSGYLFLEYLRERTGESRWAWAAQTADDGTARAIAFALLVAGLAAVIPAGAREGQGETA